MSADPTANVDSMILRFKGEDADGEPLHELRAAHVAEVLQGVAGIAGDFAKAGAFGRGMGGGEVLVRPAREGSFLIEVLRLAQEQPLEASVLGGPSLSAVVWWATKSLRADVEDFDYLENGNVKVKWQDGTVDEIPPSAWEELKKRKRRRKKQLRQMLAPLGDKRVSELEVAQPEALGVDDVAEDSPPQAYSLRRDDYDAARPDDEVEERFRIFDAEAQMSAINFDDPERWRVKTRGRTKSATLRDEKFLGRLANGLAIRQSDIFRLRIREDIVVKNGRTQRKWTVLKVESHRKAAHDSDA